MAAAEPPRLPEQHSFTVGDYEIEAVLAETSGDAREAIRNLLHDLAVMAADADAACSRGFLRGRFSEGRRLPRAVGHP